MPVKVIIKDEEVQALSEKKIPNSYLNTALEDIGQIIMASTQKGYDLQKSPDGTKWPDNVSWYKEMKGGAAILTGPTSRSIGGPLVGKYEFAVINTRRMKNSLIKTVDAIAGRVQIEYDIMAEDRAELTQVGGEGFLVLNATSSSKKIIYNIKIQPRPHLGIAEKYARVPPKTDPEWIESIVSTMMDNILTED